MKDGAAATAFTFNLDSTPELDVQGAFTIDCNSDMSIDVGGGNVVFANGGTTRFNFGVDSTPSMATVGDLLIDPSGGNTSFDSHITASGNISASGTSTGSFGAGYIDNKLGIGTTSPLTPLHIKSVGESDGGLRFQNTHDTVNMFFVGDDNDEGFQITYVGTGGAEIELQADGDLLLNSSNGDNVAIGNTSPTAKLDITGDLKVSTNITASGDISASGTITALQYDGNISGSSTSTGSFGAGFFDNKVGIGTTSPDHALHIVYNNSTTEGSISNNNAVVGLQIENTNASGVSAIHFRSSDADGYLLYDDNGANAGDFHFKTDGQDGTSTVVIKDSGNVGIGLDAPVSKLDVVGDLKVSTNITASGNYSGSSDSTFRIGGKLIAGSKSFVINRPEGGKLEYGVLEGQQNDVFFRGELKGDNVIHLPKEWEWLVDENTITVQLTSIGKHQDLYIKEIKDNKIFIDINGIFKKKENIHCYHIIYGTRKDIELIRNYQW